MIGTRNGPCKKPCALTTNCSALEWPYYQNRPRAVQCPVHVHEQGEGPYGFPSARWQKHSRSVEMTAVHPLQNEMGGKDEGASGWALVSDERVS